MSCLINQTIHKHWAFESVEFVKYGDMIETGYDNNNFAKDLTIDYNYSNYYSINYSNEFKAVLSNDYPTTVFRFIVNFSVETSQTILRVT